MASPRMKRSEGTEMRSLGLNGWVAFTLLLACLVGGVPTFAHDFGGPTTPGPAPGQPQKDPDCPPTLVDPLLNAIGGLSDWFDRVTGLGWLKNKVGSIVGNPCGLGKDSFIGDPVGPFTGKQFSTVTDLIVDGVLPIVVERHYDSETTYDSPVGAGWGFTFDVRLTEYPDGSVVIRRGAGRREFYAFTGTGYLQGGVAALTKNVDGTFTATLPMGGTARFDVFGRMTDLGDAAGNRHVFTYSANRMPITGTSRYALDPSEPLMVARDYRVERVEEFLASDVSTGRFITLAYDPATGRVDGITSSDGQTVDYTHDAKGDLRTVVDAVGIATNYTYDDPSQVHRMTGYESGGELGWTWEYDTQGRVSWQQRGLDRYDFYYDDPVEGSRRVVHTIRDDGGAVLQVVDEIYDYNAEGFPLARHDARRNKIVLDRDQENRIESTAVYRNTGSVSSPSYVLERFLSYGYGTNDDLTSRTVVLDDGEVVTESYGYNEHWLTSAQTLSSLSPQIFRSEWTLFSVGGIPIGYDEVKDRRDDGSFRVTKYESYNTENGYPESIVLPGGTKLKTEFYPSSASVGRRGKAKRQFIEVGGVAAPQRAIELDYDTKGRIKSAVDARGKTYTFENDVLGRTTKIVNPLGQEMLLTHTGPDGVSPGRLLTLVEVGRTVADGEGQLTRLMYSDMGYLEAVQRKDDAGSWLTLATYVNDSSGRVLKARSPAAHETSYEYDLLGNVSAVVNPADKRWEFQYDMLANLTEVKDPYNRRTRYTYDDLERLRKVEALDANPIEVTEYTYDAAHNLRTIKDARGNTTEYEWDALSRLTKEILPLNQTIRYAYDDRDRLDFVVNARGNKIDYSYFDWGPIQTLTVFSTEVATTPTRIITYGYDNEQNLTGVTDDAIQATPSYSWTYDDLGRPDTHTVHYLPGGARTIDYDYDRFGYVDKVTVQDGAQLISDFHVNRLGLLDDLTLPSGQYFDLTFDADLNVDTITYPSGIVEDVDVTETGEIEDVTYRNTLNATIEQFAYTLDDVGHALTMTDADGTHTYGYDELYQLISAIHPAESGLPPSESFDYDGVGNLENPADPNDYQYDANNQLTSALGIAYFFDLDGNVQSTTDGRTLTHDALHDLVGYLDAADSASYLYDAFGRRVRKTVNGATTWFLWDGTELFGEYNGTGSRVRRYAWGVGLSPLQAEADGQILNVHTDRIGAVRFLTGPDQAVLWRVASDAYGEAIVDPDVDGDSEAVEFSFRSAGQYSDTESGLHYNLFRYYDPETNRYLEKDPLGLDGDFAYYTYAAGNPTNYVDPFGLMVISLPCGGVHISLTKNLSEKYGQEMLDYHAQRATSGDSNYLQTGGYYGAAALWSLWTPCTADATLTGATLIAGGGAAKWLGNGLRAVAKPKGLGNPFRGKTPAEIDEMFRRKGFEPRGPNPASGKGGYVNPKTDRSFHIDEKNRFGEPPHVDVNRLRSIGDRLRVSPSFD